MSGIVRTVSHLDPAEVAAAFWRALDLIPHAPSPDALRRRLRRLGTLVASMDQAGMGDVGG
jgi:hypothetical protein